jgi:flavin-binding protein dodecin
MNSEGKAARTTEIIASSPRSFQDAVTVGFQRASKTLRGITGLKVSDQRCRVEDAPSLLMFIIVLSQKKQITIWDGLWLNPLCTSRSIADFTRIV